MYFVQDYSLAVLFCVVTMFCWGSWGNTQKLAGKTWRYELFYWDYVIGLVLFGIIAGLTMGSIGNQGRSFIPDLLQASPANLGSALFAGIIFNASNILLSAAIAIAGMSVAFPIGIGIAMVLGVIVNYLGDPKGDPLLLFAGVGIIMVAIVLNAIAFKIKDTATAQQASGTKKGIILSIICGVLMAFFYRFVAASMSMDFAHPEAGKMTPYSAFTVFTLGIFASTFVFNTIVMKKPFAGPPVPLSDYFKGSLKIHSVGLLGGAIWALGNILNLVAAGTAGPAISYGLGQGATLVAALWGILVWKEFKGAPRFSTQLNIAMFVLFMMGLGLIIRAGL